MSNVIITIRSDGDDDIDVKAEFEPVIPADPAFDDLPFTHKVALSMVGHAASLGEVRGRSAES
jgi:hypothetical protein